MYITNENLMIRPLRNKGSKNLIFQLTYGKLGCINIWIFAIVFEKYVILILKIKKLPKWSSDGKSNFSQGEVNSKFSNFSNTYTSVRASTPKPYKFPGRRATAYRCEFTEHPVDVAPLFHSRRMLAGQLQLRAANFETAIHVVIP